MKGESDVNITVEVRRGPSEGDISPYIIGRNGYYDITALAILARPQTTPRDDSVVDIRGIGKRGKLISGGFFCLQAEDIDALCYAWIQARGGLVVMPGDEGVTALVTICSGVVDDSVILSTNLDGLQRLADEYVGDRDPDKWEYHLEPVELLPAPQQGSEEQAV